MDPKSLYVARWKTEQSQAGDLDVERFEWCARES
jgi:hypothetical protein